jgi:hypothetical protein
MNSLRSSLGAPKFRKSKTASSILSTGHHEGMLPNHEPERSIPSHLIIDGRVFQP